MTTYFVTENYYQAHCGYEQILLAQKDQEIDQLKLYIMSLEQKLSERDEKIDMLETKVKNLLQGYTRRQMNYATSLEVWRKKAQGDADEVKKLRAENEKLKAQISSANTEKEKNVAEINGLKKENEELSKHVVNTTTFFKNEIEKKDRAFENMNKTLMGMAKTVSELKQTSLRQNTLQDLQTPSLLPASGMHGSLRNVTPPTSTDHSASTTNPDRPERVHKFNKNERGNNGDSLKPAKWTDDGKGLRTDCQGRDKTYNRPSNYQNKCRYRSKGNVPRQK